jgi:hypothetical protein
MGKRNREEQATNPDDRPSSRVRFESSVGEVPSVQSTSADHTHKKNISTPADPEVHSPIIHAYTTQNNTAEGHAFQMNGPMQGPMHLQGASARGASHSPVNY